MKMRFEREARTEIMRKSNAKYPKCNSLISVSPKNALTVHGFFDRTVKKSQKLQKSVEKNRNINTKYEKQKCDLQFAPTELNEFNI